MNRSLARTLAALLCALAPAAAFADYPPIPSFGEMEPAVDLSGPVSLQGCIGVALGRNFTVRIQEFSVFEASDAVEVQKAAFEPVFNAAVNKQVTQQASDVLEEFGIIPYSETETASFNVDDTLVTGATLQAGYSMERSSYNPSFPPNPAFASSASITVTQPLLAGGWSDYNKAEVERARLGVRISNLNFKSAVLTMVLNVETTYYNLLYQREQYKVQAEELKQAQQLLDENTLKRQTGTLTDLDVMNARAGVASAQNQLILDGQAVRNSEDSLLQLLGDKAFTTTVGDVAFPDIGEPEVSFARSYRLAREDGPNLPAAQAAIDQFKLDALRAKRNTLPTLNVTGGLGYNSFAATAGQSITGSWGGYNWVGGLTLTVPWGLHANKALYHQAESQVRSQEVAYDQADQQLLVSVRSAVRAVDTGKDSVRSSAENTQYAQKAYDLTKAQFDAGLATSYLVLQSQNTLESARVSELQAKVSLLLAIANLRFLEGSSLQLYHINLPE
ncbi:MAG TPA: TolC family protein [Opitutaceae bacterium]|jgi:outer membrane protein TolC